jgi:membrane protein required for colicin V production
MEGLNIVDGVVIVIVLISAILAYARGVTREIMAIMGWIISSIIAFIFAPMSTPLIKEIPLLGPILADSCELAIIAAFASVFALSLLIFSFFTPLLITKTRLTKIDQALGFVFGILRGLFLIAITFFAYMAILGSSAIPQIDVSKSALIFDDIITSIKAQNPERALGLIIEKYEILVRTCE